MSAVLSHKTKFMISAWHEETVVGNVDLAVETGSYSKQVGRLGLGVLEAYRGLGLAAVF